MYFVSSSIYQKAKTLALKEGLDPNHISGNHLTTDQGDQTYLPINLLWEMYEIADKHLTPGFSIRHGAQMEAEDYGTLGLSWKTCWQAKDLLKRVERYMILVTDYGHIKVDETKELTHLIINRDPVSRGLEMSNETSVAMFTKVIRDVTGAEIHPVSVSFKHGIPKDPKYFEDYFRSGVRFDQPINSLVYYSADLETPTIKADKSIHQFLLERMEEEEKGINVNSNKLIIDVQNLITEILPSGIPSIIQISEHLGMSARTLNRRLAEKGFTFRDLVREAQETISIDLLKNSPRSIGEIAFQTGFSEQSAFNRAFKRWKGLAPLEFRKNYTG
ncbi:MAG: AraC family transcriptional regulator ligand-binding domain-containing protein [Bacteroidota bacterium]